MLGLLVVAVVLVVVMVKGKGRHLCAAILAWLSWSGISQCHRPAGGLGLQCSTGISGWI